MLLKPLTVAAGLLAVPAARAFLLPPEVSDSDVKIANTLEAIGPQTAERRLVDLECPGCPVLVQGVRGNGIQLQIDRPTHLELTFTVDHSDDVERLLLNGFQLYPAGDPSDGILSAPQVVDHGDKEKRHREHHHKEPPHHLVPQPQRLGFGLHVSSGKKDANNALELIEVDLQIIEVGVAFIDGIPSVKVQLVKDESGRLLIAQVIKGEPKKLLEKPEECKTLLCKMVAAARQRLKNMRPFKNCHGGGRVKGGKHGSEHEHPHPHPHPPHHHHGGPHGGPHGKWREPSLARLFKNITSHIILPVLIGIVAGVSVSLIGMAVGTVLVSLWRFVSRRRGGHRHHHHHRHHRRHSRKLSRKDAAVAEEEEKSGLMEYQDPPPSYEEEETPKTADQVV